MNRLFKTIIPVAMIAAMAACGNGKDAQEPDDLDDLDDIEALDKEVAEALAKGPVEDDDPGVTETDPVDDKPAKPKGTGPGQLLLDCKSMGESVPCDLEIQNSETLAAVDSGTGKMNYSFSLMPGTYKVELHFDGAVNKPNLTLQQLEIPPGETVERTVVFPMAKVTFIPVSPSGKKVGGWKLRLKLMGADDWTAENVTLNKPVFISPGLYEGQLYKGKKKAKTIDISKIQVNEGATATQPIMVTH